MNPRKRVSPYVLVLAYLGICILFSGCGSLQQMEAQRIASSSRLACVPGPRTGSGSVAGETARDGRFVAYDDGTVVDTRSCLMGATKDNARDINWADARTYCENYGGGGYTDWRMPTVDELASLYDANKKNRYGYRVTELIELSNCCPWSSQGMSHLILGDLAFHYAFGFVSGWGDSSPGRAKDHRALPVRFWK